MAIIIFGITSAFFIFTNEQVSQNVLISSPYGKWIYPINEDREIEVIGSLGKTKIQIKNKQISIIDSPCKNKICITSGIIDKPDQFLACLPNSIMVQIEGKTQTPSNLDSVSY